jgi:hypothetical protein
VKPLRLIAEVVQASLPTDQIGFYRLGYLRDGHFEVGYFGRSDTSLRRRLLQHCQNAPETHFTCLPTSTILEAFRLECGEWHLGRPGVRNKIHPDAPKLLGYSCPYCELSESRELAELLGSGG